MYLGFAKLLSLVLMVASAAAVSRPAFGVADESTAALAAAPTRDFEVDLSWSVGVKTGMIISSSEGFTPDQTNSIVVQTSAGLSLQNTTVEWLWFYKKNLAASLGYRVVMGAESARVDYQAAYGGFTYFPTTLGIPISARRNLSTLKYWFDVKPYVNVALSVGRQVVARYFDNKFELSSDFYGINLGGGMQYQITDEMAIDLSGTFERTIDYGVLDYSANNVYALIGVLLYY